MYSFRGLGAAGVGTSRTGGVAVGGPAGGGMIGDSAGNLLRELESDNGATFTATDPNRTGFAPVEPPAPPANCPSPYITLMGQCVMPQVVSPGLPPLPPSACNSKQTYIPPGSVFPVGSSMAGQVTTTGACIDNAQPLPNNTVASTSPDWFTASMFGGIPNWILLAGVGVGALMLSVSGGKHGR